MHYYAFNIADYRKDTTYLSPVQHYIYRTLIDVYYLNEAPIPDKKEIILRKLGLGIARKDDLVLVLNDFFKLEGTSWHHKRIDKDIVDYQKRALVNRINGMKGGRPRKSSLTDGVTEAMPTKASAKATNKPLSIKPGLSNPEKREKLKAATKVLGKKDVGE